MYLFIVYYVIWYCVLVNWIECSKLDRFLDYSFKDFVENHSITACQDALTCFEKDVDVMIQLRFLKGLYSAVENVQEIIEVSSAHHELQVFT